MATAWQVGSLDIREGYCCATQITMLQCNLCYQHWRKLLFMYQKEMRWMSSYRECLGNESKVEYLPVMW